MISRRRSLQLLAGSAAAAPGLALGQDGYPSRAIRLVVGFPPGQSLDIGARAIAAKLTEDLGQPVVVDNLPGAAGILAHEAVKTAAPDGYNAADGSTPASPSIGALRNLALRRDAGLHAIVLINTSPRFLAGIERRAGPHVCRR